VQAVDLDTAMSFVRDKRQGALATLRRDGRPQISNIVYAVGDDALIRISVTADRAKTRNLARDPRASLYVCRDDFWKYVVVDGTATLSPVTSDPHDETADQLVALFRSLAGEHDDWDAYRAAMVRDRRLVLTITPKHAYGLVPDQPTAPT
jgi:PPOX class probable F420-dependent enzyme